MHLLTGRTSGQFYRTPAAIGPSARVPLITLLIVVVLALVAGCSDDSDADGANDTRPAAGSGDGGGGGGGNGGDAGTNVEYPAPFEPCDEISAAAVSDAVGLEVTPSGIATGGLANGVETDGCTWTGAATVTLQVLAPPDPLAYLDGLIADTYEPIEDVDLGDLSDGAVAVRFPGQPDTDRVIVPVGNTLYIAGVVVDGAPALDLATTLLGSVTEGR
jgi:hypothetical protein